MAVDTKLRFACDVSELHLHIVKFQNIMNRIVQECR